MRRGGTRPGFATFTGTLEIQDPPPPGLDLVPVSGSRTAEVSLADGLPLSARTEIEHRERVTMQEPGSSRTEEAWMTVRTVRTCARLADLPPLRVTSPPGKPLPATLVITGEQDLEVGGKGLVKHEFEFSYEFEMKGLGATPGPRVEIRFRRVHGRLNSKVLPLGEFDSAKPLPTDPNLRKAHASLTAWAGTTVRLALDAAGAIQDVEGLEAAREAAVRRLRLTPDEASELRLTMDGRRIRELFEYAFHGVPYPKDANERWTTHAVLPGTAEGMKVRIAWTHERTGTDAADPAAIASAGTVRLETDAALPLQFDTKSSTAKGSSSVSPLDGLPLAATTDVRFHGEASAGTAKVSVRQTVISRFERQADPPPARK
jgi:hypothetical protein